MNRRPRSKKHLDNCQIHSLRFSLFCLECDIELCVNCICEIHNGHKLETENFRQYRIESYKKKIEFNPNSDFDSYFRLGRLIKNNSIEIRINEDGEKKLYDKQSLYIKAVDINPKFADGYNNLASIITKSVELLDGRVFNERGLYLLAIDTDPNRSMAYFNLSHAISRGGRINLLDGTKMSDRSLLLKAIELDPLQSEYYDSLGSSLEVYPKFINVNGVQMDRESLYLKSIEIDPYNPHPYFNLGSLIKLDKNRTIQLPDGKIYSHTELLVRSCELDPKNAKTYCKLIYTIGESEKVSINGELMSRNALCIRAVEVNPKDIESYHYVILELSECGLSIIFPENIEIFPMEKEIREYYSSREMFLGTPFSFYKLFKVFVKENGVSSLTQILDRGFLSIRYVPAKVSHIVHFKSLEKFLMEEPFYIFGSKIFSPENILDTIKIIRLVIETNGSKPIPPNLQVDDPNSKYLYQYTLMKLIKDSRHTKSIKKFLAMYLIGVVKYFDIELNIKSEFIYEFINTKKIFGDNLVIDENSMDDLPTKENFYKEILNGLDLTKQLDKLFLILLYVFLEPVKSLESTVKILNSFMEVDNIVLEYYLLYKELGDYFTCDQSPTVLSSTGEIKLIDGCVYKSARELYLNSINLYRYQPDVYYSLGKLLKDDEIIEITALSSNNGNKLYSKFDLYQLSIQLGNRDSSVFYHLSLLLLDPKNKRKVYLPILDEESNNHYYNHIDLICQSIYHSPITFNHSTYRYYLSLIRYLTT